MRMNWRDQPRLPAAQGGGDIMAGQVVERHVAVGGVPEGCGVYVDSAGQAWLGQIVADGAAFRVEPFCDEGTERPCRPAPENWASHVRMEVIVTVAQG